LRPNLRPGLPLGECSSSDPWLDFRGGEINEGRGEKRKEGELKGGMGRERGKRIERRKQGGRSEHRQLILGCAVMRPL